MSEPASETRHVVIVKPIAAPYVSSDAGALEGALVLLPWERIPRYLHAVSPIGGLAVAFALEVQFGLSVTRAFPFVLLNRATQSAEDGATQLGKGES